MDDKTLQALTALAAKLGTTAEYLWGVLLKQAPIAGMIDIAMMAVWMLATVMWCRYVLRKTTKPKATDEDRYPSADWEGEASFFSWLSVVVFALATAIFVTCNVSMATAALVNPEYWALKQIFQ
jgi:hypothetical protein